MGKWRRLVRSVRITYRQLEQAVEAEEVIAQDTTNILLTLKHFVHVTISSYHLSQLDDTNQFVVYVSDDIREI